MITTAIRVPCRVSDEGPCQYRASGASRATRGSARRRALKQNAVAQLRSHYPTPGPAAALQDILHWVDVQGVHLTPDQVSTLLELMRERRSAREADRQQRLAALNRRREAIRQRRDAAYEDKLDGRIGADRWEELDRKWSQEHFQLRCEVETLEVVREPSEDDVGATLELLERAPELYLRQNDEQRARLLRVLVWNCSLDGEKIVPVYRRPFDLVAAGVETTNWYAREDLNLWPSRPERDALSPELRAHLWRRGRDSNPRTRYSPSTV